MKNFTFNETLDINSNSYSNAEIHNSISSYNNDQDINDIKIYRLNNKENLDFNNSSNNIESEIEKDIKKITKKKSKKIDLIENYLIKLKNIGYPEMGKIYLSPDFSEQEKTYNFFEFLVQKELQEKYKANYEIQLKTVKKELNIQLNKNMKIQKELEEYNQLYNDKVKENNNLKNIINKITLEKNNLSKKLESLTETLTKFESMKSIIINAFETMDYVQTSDMAKMLSRVKGAEKLIESLKSGYDETLNEMNEEINTLKNFIIELNYEFCNILENPSNINENIFAYSFMDSINIIKQTFKDNLIKLKKKIKINNIYTRSDKTFDDDEDDDNINYENTKINTCRNIINDTNTQIQFSNKFLSEDIK